MIQWLYIESKKKIHYNKILSFDEGCEWVLEVGRLEAPEKVIGYAFEGLQRVAPVGYDIQPGKDGKVYVWEALEAHIKKVGAFSFSGNSILPISKNVRYKLSDVLDAIYSERNSLNTDGIDIGLRRKYPDESNLPGEYGKYLREHKVYEVIQRNLYNTLSASPDGSGKIRVVDRPDRNYIRLCHRSRQIVETEHNETLAYIFKTYISMDYG